MNRTKWWKCDLQVATPAWDFRYPQNSDYKIDTPAARENFLNDYMLSVKAAGIEVIALADHNTGSWIDEVKQAGEKHGIIVFPGCEVTTHSGADGVHLIILGDLNKTSQDFDRLLHGAIGFSDEHPAFRESGGSHVPCSSSNTLIQILEALPDGYLAIAPHACSENGIASAKTIKGDMRWKSLHHDRLVAIDPGDCSDITGDGFNSKFRRRELSEFPRLRDIAFVSTSDAYSFDEIGKRFTWIRMGKVGLEGLRQAFLDHESRVLCDWSPGLEKFIDRNPNNIRHAWISEVTLGGTLGNSYNELTLSLHPNLNVIIGGRGSGKSSVVSALRQLYSTTDNLPPRLKDEAERFVDNVFSDAHLYSAHHIQESQELQKSIWKKLTGSQVELIEGNIPTNFPVTVISQKELFERAAGDKNDPNLSSRSLLALLDSRIGYSTKDTKILGGYGRRLEDARTDWANAAREFVLMKSDLDQLSGLQSQEVILQGQVNAFTSPEVKLRFERINARSLELQFLESKFGHLQQSIIKTHALADEVNKSPTLEFEVENPFTQDYLSVVNQLNTIANELSATLINAADKSGSAISELVNSMSINPWNMDREAAAKDLEEYKKELQAKGLSTSEFSRLQEELKQVTEKIRNLEDLQAKLNPAKDLLTNAWQILMQLVDERRNARQGLLSEIEVRSGRLRFKTNKGQDTSPWVESFRTAVGIRADAFLEDVPSLAAWLWSENEVKLDERWALWRESLSTGDFQRLQKEARLRATFAERLAGFEESVRLRLATLIPDDVVVMEFLKEGGISGGDSDWQSITQGSPGQRTAAMLAFVLHHGREPLILDQPEDDLDSEWISKLVVKELRQSRWNRQLIVISHNANIPVLGDAEQVTALENFDGSLRIRQSEITDEEGVAQIVLHSGPVENEHVRTDIQSIMEGGVAAFVKREQKYNNETRQLKTIR